MHTNYGISNLLNFVWKSSPTPSSHYPITIPVVITHSAGLCSSCPSCSLNRVVWAVLCCAEYLYLAYGVPAAVSHCSYSLALLRMDTCYNKHLWAAGFPCHHSWLGTHSRPAYTCLHICIIVAILQVLPLECCTSKLLELFFWIWNIFHICTPVKYDSTRSNQKKKDRRPLIF